MAARKKRRDLLVHSLRHHPWLAFDAVRQFQISLLLLVGLLLFGIGGYIYLERMTLLEAAYMTIITLTTVGFGEVRPLSEVGRLFTINLILLGVSLTAYAVRNAFEIAAGDRLWVSLGEREMTKQLAAMHDHYIICGYGRMGREIVREFQRRGEHFIVVDQTEALHEHLLELGIPHVLGDATHDEVLLQAGIERARGLLSVVSSDADNVLIVLSAKGLNPNVKVVARASTEEMESKLRRAGADNVTSPYVIGGQRMAFALVRPAVYDFLNTVVYSEELHSEMGQVEIRNGSPLAGETLRGSDLRQKWGAIVVAVIDRNGQIIIGPSPTQRLEVGDTLIVVAPTENLRRLEADHPTLR
jgi:voltage-gated potassium channel